MATRFNLMTVKHCIIFNWDLVLHSAGDNVSLAPMPL